MSRPAPIPAALVALALAAAPGAGAASGTDGAGVLGLEVGAGYSSATPRSASSKAALNGGAVRAIASFGVTDSLGILAAAQIAWYEPRQPIVAAEYTDENGEIVESTAYGDPFTRTRLQQLGLGLAYTLDVLWVVPFLRAGVASLRAVEEVRGAARVDYDAVLWLEVGADLAVARRFRVGASALFDVPLAGHTGFTAATGILLRAALLLGPAKVGAE